MISPVIALLVSFCITGIYTLIYLKAIRICLFSVGDSVCPQPVADKDFMSTYQDSYLGLLCLINVCVLVVLKYCFYFYLMKLHNQDVEHFVSPRNFTLLCKVRHEALQDPNVKLDELIANVINDGGVNDLVETFKINPIYDIGELLSVTSELMTVERKIKIIERGIDISKYSRAEKQAEVQTLDALKKILRDKQNDMLSRAMKPQGLGFTGWVFITFKTVNDLMKVKTRKHLSLHNMKFGAGSPWRTVPEPADIIWQNWAATYTHKMIIRIGGFLLVVLIIAVNFGIIVGFKFLQKRVSTWLATGSTSAVTTLEIIVSILISIFIGVVNFLIRLLLIWLTQFEYYKTYSTLYAEIVFKVVLLQWVNKALIVLITNKITSDDQTWQIFGSAGTIGNMMVSMIISVFFDVILYLIDPKYMMKLWKRRKIRKAGQVIAQQVFQVEANEAWEGIKFDISEAYFLSFTTLAVAFFYQAIIPYGLLLGLLELVLKYLVVKYVLVKRSVRPQDLEWEFTRKMFHQFEFTVFLLALGFVVFYVIFRTDGAPLNAFYAVSIGIAGADWLVFSRLISLWVNQDHDPKIKGSFEELELNFPIDYDRQNPATQRNAFVRFLKKLNCREDFLPSEPATPETVEAGHIQEDLIENIENYALHAAELAPTGGAEAGTTMYNAFVRPRRNLLNASAAPEPYNFQAFMNEPHMRSFLVSARAASHRVLGTDPTRQFDETTENPPNVHNQTHLMGQQYELELLRHSVLYGRSNRVLTDSIANYNSRRDYQTEPLVRIDEGRYESEVLGSNRILKEDFQTATPVLDAQNLETNAMNSMVDPSTIKKTEKPSSLNSIPQVIGQMPLPEATPLRPSLRRPSDEALAQFGGGFSNRRLMSNVSAGNRPRQVSWAGDLTTPVPKPRNSQSSQQFGTAPDRKSIAPSGVTVNPVALPESIVAIPPVMISQVQNDNQDTPETPLPTSQQPGSGRFSNLPKDPPRNSPRPSDQRPRLSSMPPQPRPSTAPPPDTPDAKESQPRSSNQPPTN